MSDCKFATRKGSMEKQAFIRAKRMKCPDMYSTRRGGCLGQRGAGSSKRLGYANRNKESANADLLARGRARARARERANNVTQVEAGRCEARCGAAVRGDRAGVRRHMGLSRCTRVESSRVDSRQDEQTHEYTKGHMQDSKREQRLLH